jgi:hypothetical protein
MVLLVKEKNYRTITKKVLSSVFLVSMFYFYYIHMSDKFKEDNNKLKLKLNETKELLSRKRNLKSKVERIIYKEAENSVELLGQDKIQEVKIVKNRLIIICDWDTNIEPLFIRYGVIALIKSTPENIKIAIDLKFIVESKYEA